MPLEIYTAQYKYKGDDRLDITVQGNDSFGQLFSPTWGMVNGYKDGSINKEMYTIMYHTLMKQSYRFNYEDWVELLNWDIVTLVCFCKKGEFCHRLLLAEYLVKCGAEYIGER